MHSIILTHRTFCLMLNDGADTLHMPQYVTTVKGRLYPEASAYTETTMLHHDPAYKPRSVVMVKVRGNNEAYFTS